MGVWRLKQSHLDLLEEWDFFFPFGDPESWGSFMCVQASRVALVVKNLPANVGDLRDAGSIPGSGRSPRERNGNPIFLPGKSHGQRSLAGYSP